MKQDTNRPIWDRRRLEALVRERLGGRRLIVVANREPYVHTFGDDGGITCARPVGGLTEALDPVLRAAGGTWVAQASGDADRKTADAGGHIGVPPDAPAYTLHRIWLTEPEYRGFYLGFANGALWPLCHGVFVPPVYHEADWDCYRAVNDLFADAAAEAAGGEPAVVLVQDYHFALLPAMLRKRRPELVIGQFWHIPWPAWEAFRTCPWRKEIITGMLGNDLIGFHTNAFCRNFKSAVRRSGVVAGGRETKVEAFPISVDFTAVSGQAADTGVGTEMKRLARELRLEDKTIFFGSDRMDYTKGIPERLLAYRRFLDDNPDYRGRVVFIQAGMPSRTQLRAYQELGHRIERLVTDINETHGTADWQPVIVLAGYLAPDTLNALRRLAHCCVVSSLDDGMNLVAKEYAAARNDGDGVLILSEFAGAAVELTGAVLINPYDTAGFAAALKTAVEMPEKERRSRMVKLRRTVRRNNIYRWGGALLSRLLDVAEA